MKRLYIARSKNVPDKLLKELLQTCHEVFPNQARAYWRNGSIYTTSALLNADTIIVLVASSSMNIGKGVYTEIKKALNYGKTVIVSYKRQIDNTIQFYQLQAYNNYSNASWSCWAQIQIGSNITESLRKVNSGNSFPIQAIKTCLEDLDGNSNIEVITTVRVTPNKAKRTYCKRSPALQLSLSTLIGRTRKH